MRHAGGVDGCEAAEAAAAAVVGTTGDSHSCCHYRCCFYCSDCWSHNGWSTRNYEIIVLRLFLLELVRPIAFVRNEIIVQIVG